MTFLPNCIINVIKSFYNVMIGVPKSHVSHSIYPTFYLSIPPGGQSQTDPNLLVLHIKQLALLQVTHSFKHF